jgi:6-phosphogluconolactonase (cycloisomerase 2 family)
MKAASPRFFLSTFLIFTTYIFLMFTVGCGQVGMNSNMNPGPSPTPIPGVTNPSNFTYVTVQATSRVEGLKINSGGAVEPIPGSPFMVPEGPLGLARTQQFLFVSSSGFIDPITPDKYLITTYRIDPDTGALTEVARHQSLIPANLSVDPEQRFLYAKMRDGVAVFSIGASGQLVEIPGSPFSSSAGLEGVSGQIVLHPSGHFLYSIGLPSGHDPTVGMIVGTVDPITGAASQGRFIEGTPTAVTLTPDGKFLLATFTNPSVPNSLCSYAIDPVNGYPGGSFSTSAPQSTSCASSGAGGVDVAVTPSGSFAMVTNIGSGSVSVFRISSGILAEVPGSPFPDASGPSWVTFSRDGRLVFVANRSGDVTVYQFDGNTGTLTPVPGSPFKLTGVPVLILS